MRTPSTASAHRPNGFLRRLQAVYGLPLPGALQQRIVSLAAGQMVPYLRTSAVRIERVSRAEAQLWLGNHRRVQNHMQSVHACAMVLLAEAATGTVLMASLPDGSLFSTTRIEVDYTRKAVGDLRAIARLSSDEQARVEREPKGRLNIPVTLIDSEGNSPAAFTITWSWRHRKAS